MEQEEIRLRVTGKNGNEALSPGNFDISEIKVLLDSVESLLFPDSMSRKKRPTISYEMQEGSVINIFRTSLQSVIAASSIITAIVHDNGSIDRLECNSAKAIESLQEFARVNDYIIEISTSDKPDRKFKLDKTTNYVRRENLMVDAEFYFYGLLVDAGGKDKANIHLDTKDFGILTIRSKKDYLLSIKGNPLYRNYGVRVKAKQNALTGSIDKTGLELVELIDYTPKFDEKYLSELIAKATPKWKNTDASTWLNELRGGL